MRLSFCRKYIRQLRNLTHVKVTGNSINYFDHRTVPNVDYEKYSL